MISLCFLLLLHYFPPYLTQVNSLSQNSRVYKDVVENGKVVGRILYVPYFSQGATQWCWANSLAMVLQYYGIRKHPWDIAQELNKGHDEEANPLEYLNKLGLTYEMKIFEGYDYYRDCISNLHPVLYGGSIILNGSHLIVIVGYKENSTGKYLYIHDPSGAFTRDYWKLNRNMYAEVNWSTFSKIFDRLVKIFSITITNINPNPPRSVLFLIDGYINHSYTWGRDYVGELLYLNNKLIYAYRLIKELSKTSSCEAMLSSSLVIDVYISNQYDDSYTCKVLLKILDQKGNIVSEKLYENIPVPSLELFLFVREIPLYREGLRDGRYVLEISLWDQKSDFSSKPIDAIKMDLIVASNHALLHDVELFNVFKAYHMAYLHRYGDYWSFSFYAKIHQVHQKSGIPTTYIPKRLEFKLYVYDDRKSLIYEGDWVSTDTDNDDDFLDPSPTGGWYPSVYEPKNFGYPLPKYLDFKVKWRLRILFSEEVKEVGFRLYTIPRAKFHVDVNAGKCVYQPGETCSLNIRIVNVGSSSGSFTLGVSLKSMSGGIIDLTHSYSAVTLDIGEEKVFKVNYSIPIDAEAGFYSVAVNCWESPYEVMYEDDLEWRDKVFLVGKIDVHIVSPSMDNVVNVGAYNNPYDFNAIIKVLAGSFPIDSRDLEFKVFIAGKECIFTSSTGPDGSLILNIKPPTVSSPGLYDLIVKLYISKCEVASATSPKSIRYVGAGIGNVNIILVIDRSGSMSGEKIDRAKECSKIIVDMLRDGDYVGVVSFSDRVSVDADAVMITGDVKSRVKSRVDSIVASGSTDIGDALNEALNQLSRGDIKANGYPRVIVLLSDGRHNTGTHPDNVLPLIRSEGVTVYTIGLGGDVDEELMRRIASETNGKYYFSPSASELAELFNIIGGIVTKRERILSLSTSINPGGNSSLNVIVDESMRDLTFSISWSSPPPNITLYNPLGIPLPLNMTRVVSGKNYMLIEVINPMKGLWTVGISNPFSSLISLALTVFSNARAVLRSSTDRVTYSVGEPIKVYASLLSDEGTIRGAVIKAILMEATGKVISSINLVDDGFHDDSNPDDGLYGGIFSETLKEGLYYVTVRTLWPIMREDRLTINVKSKPPSIEVTPNTLKITLSFYETVKLNLKIKSIEENYITISSTDLIGKYLNISSSYVKPSINNLVMGKNTEKIVSFEIKAPHAPPDRYNGSIVISSSRDSVRIPVSITLEPIGLMVKPSTLSMQLRPGLKSETILEVFEPEGYRNLVNVSLIKQGGEEFNVSFSSEVINVKANSSEKVLMLLEASQKAKPGSYSFNIIVKPQNTIHDYVKVEVSVLPLLKLKVNTEIPSRVVVDKSFPIKIIVLDEYGNPVNNANVTLSVMGKKYRLELTGDGVYETNLALNKTGKYSMEVNVSKEGFEPTSRILEVNVTGREFPLLLLLVVIVAALITLSIIILVIKARHT
jgi:uncharacterized membrane protein/uncharacterized protein YegL